MVLGVSILVRAHCLRVCSSLGLALSAPRKVHYPHPMPTLNTPPFNRTKIVVTLGPASDSVEMIQNLVSAGADVFRINMSHAGIDSAVNIIARVREVSDAVAILVDTKGPELRTTNVLSSFELSATSRIEVAAGFDVSSESRIYVGHPALLDFVRPGQRIFLDDGLIVLLVEAIDDEAAVCLVERGGTVTSRRGVNLPGVEVFPPELTDSDQNTIQMAAQQKADFLAASFVQSADEVRRIRALLEEGGAATQIIAKIETRKAVDHLSEILEAADGIMVARGDLGVEIPAEEVPLVQKQIIRECNRAGKPVIVATQMLESMVNNPIATRAETSDVANAILDGTDAVMLSGETAKGSYPVQAVETLARVSDHVEHTADLFRINLWRSPAESTADFVSKAVCRATQDLEVDYIVALTSSGTTARLVSRYKPRPPILASTPHHHVARQLALSYGVKPVVVEREGTYNDVLGLSLQRLLEKDLLEPTHRVLVTFGLPMGTPGSTNFLGCDTVERLLGGFAH